MPLNKETKSYVHTHAFIYWDIYTYMYKNKTCISLLFNGISTFSGYLMPNPTLLFWKEISDTS